MDVYKHLISVIKPKVFDFLSKHSRDVGIISVCFGITEKLLDSDFVCFCEPCYDKWLCACYAIVPFFAFLIYILCNLDVFSKAEGGGKQDESRRDDVPESQHLLSGLRASEPENRGTEDLRKNTKRSFTEKREEVKSNRTSEKCIYCLLISSIWLFFFFVDGHYLSCGLSHWGGEYTVTGAIKWCKPKGNDTEVLGRLQETQKYIFISKVSLNSTQTTNIKNSSFFFISMRHNSCLTG
ncbi:uncharacterized protein LOC113634620 isoform X1 [Tachysurus ichikawai]